MFSFCKENNSTIKEVCQPQIITIMCSFFSLMGKSRLIYQHLCFVSAVKNCFLSCLCIGELLWSIQVLKHSKYILVPSPMCPVTAKHLILCTMSASTGFHIVCTMITCLMHSTSLWLQALTRPLSLVREH